MNKDKMQANEEYRRYLVEKMWLNYYNNHLLKEGIITVDQHKKMEVQILCRRPVHTKSMFAHTFFRVCAYVFAKVETRPKETDILTLGKVELYMIYYTGDIHGEKYEIVRFCKRFNPTREDTIIILGDVGANYYGDERDAELKAALNSLKPTILCIHGNHEIRPWNLPSYTTKEWNGGIVWYEEAYPSVLFAKDGEIYDIEGLKHIAIGGAYSVDKYYRLARRYGWWEDEQPSEEIKQYVERQLKTHEVDVILSHTCPFKYEPVETFLLGIDQSTVDTSTEKWLDQIEETTEYLAWYCGHWHINKRIDKMHFLFHTFESSEANKELLVMKRLSDDDLGVRIGNFNTVVTFAVRYALGKATLAAATMKRIVLENLDILHKQTKYGIIQDIEDYIDQHETVADLTTWNDLVKELRQDLERK